VLPSYQGEQGDQYPFAKRVCVAVQCPKSPKLSKRNEFVLQCNVNTKLRYVNGRKRYRVKNTPSFVRISSVVAAMGLRSAIGGWVWGGFGPAK